MNHADDVLDAARRDLQRQEDVRVFAERLIEKDGKTMLVEIEHHAAQTRQSPLGTYCDTQACRIIAGLKSTIRVRNFLHEDDGTAVESRV